MSTTTTLSISFQMGTESKSMSIQRPEQGVTLSQCDSVVSAYAQMAENADSVTTIVKSANYITTMKTPIES